LFIPYIDFASFQQVGSFGIKQNHAENQSIPAPYLNTYTLIYFLNYRQILLSISTTSSFFQAQTPTILKKSDMDATGRANLPITYVIN